MDVICSGCGRHYKIDDDKLPTEGTAYLTCPGCKDRIKIEAPGKKAAGIQSTGFEFFEPGTKTTLVYCPEARAMEQLNKGLTNLGYETRSIKKKDDIASRFRYHIYDIIFLYQKGPDPEDDLIDMREYIGSLQMDMRRKTFVVYVHLAGNRHDSLQAFSLGVDLSINPLEIGNLSNILLPALDAKEVTYKIYFECKARVEEEVF